MRKLPEIALVGAVYDALKSPALAVGRSGSETVSRLLAEEEFDSAALWLLVKLMVRQHDRQEEREEAAVPIIDETIEEKPYTHESELIFWHYDHSWGRNVKGMNLISALYP